MNVNPRVGSNPQLDNKKRSAMNATRNYVIPLESLNVTSLRKNRILAEPKIEYAVQSADESNKVMLNRC